LLIDDPIVQGKNFEIPSILGRDSVNVDVSELTWKEKEDILRLLFSKMNNVVLDPGNKPLKT
jgi:hypothetical protein